VQAALQVTRDDGGGGGGCGCGGGGGVDDGDEDDDERINNNNHMLRSNDRIKCASVHHLTFFSAAAPSTEHILRKLLRCSCNVVVSIHWRACQCLCVLPHLNTPGRVQGIRCGHWAMGERRRSYLQVKRGWGCWTLSKGLFRVCLCLCFVLFCFVLVCLAEALDAGDCILTFNDVLTILRTAGLFKVSCTLPCSAAEHSDARHRIISGPSRRVFRTWRSVTACHTLAKAHDGDVIPPRLQVTGDDGLSYSEHKCNEESQVGGGGGECTLESR
jgi:hypothetical protein